MKVFKLLRGHVLAVIAIFALLVVQANVELALPSYMSDRGRGYPAGWHPLGGAG